MSILGKSHFCLIDMGTLKVHEEERVRGNNSFVCVHVCVLCSDLQK